MGEGNQGTLQEGQGDLSGGEARYRRGVGAANVLKSKEGFWFAMEGRSNARSSNTATRDLLGDDRFMEAILAETKVGYVKKGVLKQD